MTNDLSTITWKSFMESKRLCEDLSKVYCDLEDNRRGFIYLDHWYIEWLEDGNYYLPFYSQDWLSKDLDLLEAKLYIILREENGGAP